MTALTDSLLPAAAMLEGDAQQWDDDRHRAGLHGPSEPALSRRKAAADLEALRRALRNPPEVTVARNDAPDAFGCEAWVARRRQPDGTHRLAFGPTVEAAMLTLLDGVDRRDVPCGYVPSDHERDPDLADRIEALVRAATRAGREIEQGHGIAAEIPVTQARRALYDRLQQHGLDGTGWSPNRPSVTR